MDQKNEKRKAERGEKNVEMGEKAGKQIVAYTHTQMDRYVSCCMSKCIV